MPRGIPSRHEHQVTASPLSLIGLSLSFSTISPKKMKSLLFLGLTGLAANVQAHPQRREANEAHLASRSLDIDISKFRLPELSTYTNATKTESSDTVASIGKRETYIETAKDLVKSIAPDAEFRLVEDHYVGTNGVAHVNFKQTVHGIDVDNADFNVNVSVIQ